MAHNDEENIYRGVGFDAYGAGKETRNQVQNLQDFGRTVGQIGLGVAAMPGKTLEGMRSAAGPYMDQQFADMEAQGRGVRQGFSDFARGFGGSSAPVVQTVPAPSKQAAVSQGLPTPAAPQAQAQGGIQGWAARNNPNPRPYVASRNTYDRDAPAGMAQQLAYDSQQRMAPQHQPWGDAPMGSTQHGLYQLDVMRQLRDSPSQQVQYSPPEKTQDQLDNEEKSRRWRQDELIEMAKRDPRLQNVIGHIIQANSAQHINQNTVAGRMNELALQGHNQFGIEGLRGRNQLAAEDARGKHQLAGYGLQERMRGDQEARRDTRSLEHAMLSEGLRGQNARAVKQMDLDDPYRQAQIGEAEARAGLYGVQRQSAEEQLKFDKSADKAIREWAKTYMESGGMTPEAAMRKAIQTYLGSKRNAMANGGVVGYADGGAVDNPYAWGDAVSGITRKTINGIDHITDPNAPGGANYSKPNTGLGGAGGYGSFTNSAGKTFGDAPKGPNYGGGIGQAMGANRDGDVTITPNQRAQAMAGFANRDMQYEIDNQSTPRARLQAMVAALSKPYDQNGNESDWGRRNSDEAFRSAFKDEFGSVSGYADGGAVKPMSAAEKLLADMDAKYGKTAGSAPHPAQQPAPAPQPVQQPQGMADRFRGYFGSPDARMKQNGLAFGGAVPAQDVPGGRAVAQAVAGRQVFGQSDGSGRDDALPAVIDGERPAALTSGEFVWPVNAVKYFGMAKLNKMLAEAEKGMAPQDEPA